MKSLISHLRKHSGFRKYFKNTSWLFTEKIFRIAASLFVGVWVTRYLGPEKYGLLSYAGSFVGLFMTLPSLGLNGIIVRELVKAPKHKDILLGTAFCLKIGGTLLMWICISVAVLCTQNTSQTNMLIAIIAFSVIFQSFDVIDFNYQAEVKSKFVVYIQLVELALSSALKITLILMSASLIWFALVFLFDATIHCLGLTAVYLKNTGPIWYWKWNTKTAKTLLKDSWPLIISGMAIAIYMKIDQVMIKEMMDTKQVGLYAAAARLSEACYFIPIVITSSLFPAIINAKKLCEKLYNKRLQLLYDLMTWLGIAIAITTTFFAPFIIRVIYGKVFSQSSEVLSIHIWSGVFVFMGVASGKWLIAENLQVFSLINTSIGAIINIFLNYILIRDMGINGAAISTLISQFAAAYLCLALSSKTRINFIRLSNSLLLKRLFYTKK